MDRFLVLKALVAQAEVDAIAFYGNGNKAAGARLRKKMQQTKSLAQEIRKEVSTLKNA